MISITVFKEQVSYSKLYYFYSVEYTPPHLSEWVYSRVTYYAMSTLGQQLAAHKPSASGEEIGNVMTNKRDSHTINVCMKTRNAREATSGKHNHRLWRCLPKLKDFYPHLRRSLTLLHVWANETPPHFSNKEGHKQG